MAVDRRHRAVGALLEPGREDERARARGDAYAPRAAHGWSRSPTSSPRRCAARWTTPGSTTLYSHQADALHAALDGPTIVTTGHRLGQVAVLSTADARASCPPTAAARALYLYPTKALAQDQARALARASALHKRPPGDLRRRHAAGRARGDPQAQRTSSSPTPTCSTSGSSPTTPRGASCFANLAFVVVDEAHVYRGVFGSHVGNVLRRLRRLAAILRHRAALPARQRDDRQPARARRAAHRPGRLQPDRPRRRPDGRAPGRDVEPAAARRGLGLRGSALAEAAELFSELIAAGARTICFMKSRKGVELILRHAPRPARRRARRADRALPRRLHAAAAPGASSGG